MDQELEMTAESRQTQNDTVEDVDTNVADDDALSKDVHVLSNLMQSLEASGGGSGPVMNMMKEMEGA